MLTMRNFPRPHKSFKEFLDEVKENSFKAYENQDYPFEQLIAQLGLERSSTCNPLVEIVFDLAKVEFSHEALTEREDIGWKFKRYDLEKREAKFDLDLGAFESRDSVYYYFKYPVQRFKRETIRRLGRHFRNIIEEIAENPGIKIADIKMLDLEEKEDIIRRINYKRNKVKTGITTQIQDESMAVEFDL
jgi:non-ribosomal peptide synthetase component F